MLYALGSNGSGQLGLGHFNDVSAPTSHEMKFGGPHLQPIMIRAGGNHTLILLSNGDLYISGSVTDDHHPTTNSQRIDSTQTWLFKQHVQLCSATWESSVLVGGPFELCTYGKGDKGELGREAGAEKRLQLPTASMNNDPPPRIIDIASGVQHTVVVLDNGEAWGWGNGRKGQLGEPVDIVTQPRKIAGLDFKVARVACGREFTFVVSDSKEGRIVVLGSDRWGVVSQAPNSVVGWKDIGACWGTAFCLKQSGNVLSWGRNDHGQLTPNDLPGISQIACGSEHCLALTNINTVIAWGWGEHGNCGPNIDQDGDVKKTWAELSLPEIGGSATIVGIGAGCATSWVWTL